MSKRSLDYSNLIASCYGFSDEKTCGKMKENKYDAEQFVSPLNLDCEDIFSYLPNGHIEGNQYPIDLLNLDSYKFYLCLSPPFQQFKSKYIMLFNNVF